LLRYGDRKLLLLLLFSLFFLPVPNFLETGKYNVCVFLAVVFGDKKTRGERVVEQSARCGGWKGERGEREDGEIDSITVLL